MKMAADESINESERRRRRRRENIKGGAKGRKRSAEKARHHLIS